MKDGYDPEFDSPEARANFATRHIYNLSERVRRRNELLKKFNEESVVDMLPGVTARRKYEHLRVEAEWVQDEVQQSLKRDGIAHSLTDMLIQCSADSSRIRAVLLTLVFFERFVRTHYPSCHATFAAQITIPKLRHYTFTGYASPHWLAYSDHGDDKATDWNQVSVIFTRCANHLGWWLSDELSRPVPEMREAILSEVSKNFASEQHRYFEVPYSLSSL